MALFVREEGGKERENTRALLPRTIPPHQALSWGARLVTESHAAQVIHLAALKQHEVFGSQQVSTPGKPPVDQAEKRLGSDAQQGYERRRPQASARHCKAAERFSHADEVKPGGTHRAAVIFLCASGHHAIWSNLLSG
ncbi:hypothetical protein SKAU_G00136130 [Synaphobranchus kaupii]|uniref:Uncharacterized protein n=1 Tax=Synaphobranchus kaupii TaxID=118154 RepID=A0A9Q1FSC4_SYNKA|nr:hypothetical protein SKAU_G00136130 [Synaphobranchus kaupii]